VFSLSTSPATTLHNDNSIQRAEKGVKNEEEFNAEIFERDIFISLLIFLGYENSIMACGIAAEREEGVE
jgi:hypothetical protein